MTKLIDNKYFDDFAITFFFQIREDAKEKNPDRHIRNLFRAK